MASIRKRKDSYQITVSLGRDAEGKQLLETTTCRPEATTPRAIEKEVDQFAKDFEKRVCEGKYLDGEKVSFTSFVETWLIGRRELSMQPMLIIRQAMTSTIQAR